MGANTTAGLLATASATDLLKGAPGSPINTPDSARPLGLHRLWARLEAVDVEPGLIDGVDRVIVATNVTELKQAQSELAEQVRSKDEFIAAASHELSTSLTSVLGFAELINEEGDRLSPVAREMTDRLLGGANDMAHIIGGLARGSPRRDRSRCHRLGAIQSGRDRAQHGRRPR